MIEVNHSSGALTRRPIARDQPTAERDSKLWRLKTRVVGSLRRRRSLLRCIGFALAFPIALAPLAGQAAGSMTFAVATLGGGNEPCGRNCAEVISAKGEINNDTADEFLAFLSSHLQEQGLRPVVLLESPGGTVVGAMQLGMMFRKIGAAVIVAEAVEEPGTDRVRVAPGLCMSACVYAFFGGKKRVVPPVSKLGIHRMVINESMRDPAGGMVRQQTFGTDDIVSTLSAYTKMMGIDPNVIEFAERVSPDTIHIVTPKEIARWRLGAPRL